MITIERELPVINGFVTIPDGQRLLRTKLSPLDVLALIPGSTLFRLSPGSVLEEIIVSDATSINLNGFARRMNRLFVRLPSHNQLDSPADDWFAVLRDAASA